MAKENIKVEIVETPNWKYGKPKDPTIPKKLVAITPSTLFRCCITDKDYEKIKKAFHQADTMNMKNLQNAETPFIIKDIVHTISILNGDFPDQYKPLLRKVILELIDKNVEIKEG